MSTFKAAEAPRRTLSEQQAETVNKLTTAALELCRTEGGDAVTVRTVARRAQVALATAYKYFSSRDHLVVEVFWRRLQDNPLDAAADSANSRVDRVVAVLRHTALLAASEPELASANTASMLGSDPEVEKLRWVIGVEIRRRMLRALEARADDSDRDHAVLADLTGTIEVLESIYAGALLRAGMGYGTYAEMADLIEYATRTYLS